MKNSVLSPESIICRNPQAIFSQIDSQFVLMNLDIGNYYTLDDIGSRIWELLEAPTTLSELCRLLVNEYQIDEPTCNVDISIFIKELINNHLVKIK